MKLQSLLVLIVCLCWTASARAEDDRAGAVMIKLSPKARDAEVVRRAATQVLSGAGWAIKDVKFSERDIAAITACMRASEERKCINALLRAKKIARLAVYSLTLETRTNELVVTGEMVTMEEGMIPAIQRFCEQCTDDTAAEHAVVLTKRMLDEIAKLGGRTVLDVRTVPASAVVYVDGESVGFSDLKVPIAPGAHKVRIELAGYVTTEREVVGVDGTTTKIHDVLVPGKGQKVVTMPAVAPAVAAPAITQPSAMQSPQPTKVPLAGPAQSKASTLAPVSLMILGGGAVVAGAVFIALDEDVITVPKEQRQPQYHLETLVPGIALVTGGVTAGVIGYFWRRSISTKTTPLVGVSNQGISMGLSGSF